MLGFLKGSFRHGIHPRDHKESTAGLRTERMPFAERYVLPLSQHLGAPSKPVVRVGKKVRRGQVVAEPGGFVSATLHSPVDGKVSALATRHHPSGKLVDAIEIEADPFATQRLEERSTDWRELDDDAFVGHLQKAGLVGMGGAAFPTHVKYKVPVGKKIRRLLVNGCECEPYLTADHRLMAEHPEEILRGVEIAATRLGVEETAIGVELNKGDAIEALRSAVARRKNGGVPIRIVPLKVKYPQGAEKMLVQAIYGIEVPPPPGLPLDVGCLVNNVGTMAAIADYFDRGQPLIERVVTVSGPGVVRPANVLVPVGTPVRDVLEHCGGLRSDTREVVMGGPMMGTPLASLDVPILKGTSGILAFTEEETRIPKEYTCIKCGRCVEACPHFLNPSLLSRLAKAGRYEEAQRQMLMDCVECGSCSYTCPSGIPIVQLIRVAKSALREEKRKAKAS